MGPTPEPTAELSSRLADMTPVVLAEPGRARAELRQLLTQARRMGAAEVEVRALLELSRCDFFQGRYEDMHDLAQQALKRSRQGNFPTLEARALNSLGLSALRQRQVPQAMTHFMDALRVAVPGGDETSAGLTLGNIALVYAQLGQHHVSLKLQSQVQAVMQRTAQPVYLAFALSNLLNTHRQLGQHAHVLKLAVQVIQLCRAQGISRFECTAYIALGRTLLDLGRREAARRTATAGLRVARWAQDRESMAALRLVEGQALLAQRQTAEAATSLEDALKLSTAVGVDQQLNVHDALARLHDARGQLGRAEHHRELLRALTADLPAPATRPAQGETLTGAFGPYAWAPELSGLSAALDDAVEDAAQQPSRDPLTGLLDRPALQAALRDLLDVLGPEDLLGVLSLSVDQIRAVNERFGQAGGDGLLREVARRVQGALRPGDVTGRVGRDEFMVVLPHLAQAEDLRLVIRRLLDALRPAFLTGGEEISLSVSVGGALAPQDGTAVDELLRHADLALHQAKSAGRSGAHLYEAALSAAEQQRRVLRYDLRTALRYRELRLHYQPIYALPGEQLMGFEALLRWQHPRLGLLRPGQFIPLAEESRLILDLGDWALCEAARQAVRWDFARRNLSMSVNVSALQFAQPDFVRGVRAALRDVGVSGEHVILELTESALLPEAERTAAHIRALEAIGVRLAVDDFGSGYSSLSLLQQESFHMLKIDRSFLRDMCSTSPDAAPKRDRAVTLVELTVDLARRLNMRVLAEGVELPEQLDVLRRLGCDGVQGFLLGAPLPPEAVELP